MKLTSRKKEFKPTGSQINDANGKQGEAKPVNFPKDIGEVRNGTMKSDFHVNHLIEKLADVARPNLYKVMIIPPRALQADWDGKGSGFLVLAKSTQIPSITLKNYTHERAGQRLEIPNGTYEYGDASITFWIDSNYDIKTLFHRWQRLGLANWATNRIAKPIDALDSSLIVYTYDYDLKPVFATKLIYAWPQTISEVSLGQDMENTAGEFTVNFKYSSQDMYQVTS